MHQAGRRILITFPHFLPGYPVYLIVAVVSIKYGKFLIHPCFENTAYFTLLQKGELIFRKYLCCDINTYAYRCFPSILSRNAAAFFVNPDDISIFFQHSVGDGIQLIFFTRLYDLFFHTFPVTGVNAVENQPFGALKILLIRIPQMPEHVVVYKIQGKSRFAVTSQNAAGHIFTHQPEQVAIELFTPLLHRFLAELNGIIFIVLLLSGRHRNMNRTNVKFAVGLTH